MSYKKIQKRTVRKLMNKMNFWVKTWNSRMSHSTRNLIRNQTLLLHHKLLLMIHVAILRNRNWVGMPLLMKLYTKTQWARTLKWIKSVLFQSCKQCIEVSSHNHQQCSHNQTPKPYSDMDTLVHTTLFFLHLSRFLYDFTCFELCFQNRFHPKF